MIHAPARTTRATIAIVLFASALSAPNAWGQDPSGSAGAATAGGMLGLVSGAMVTNLGTVLPCTQTTLGVRCVVGTTIFGGALGFATGFAVGASNADLVIERATSGLVGLGVGVLVTFAGRPLFQRIGLEDVLAIGLVGGAIGTQPRSALVGFAAGAVTGVGLWRTVPGIEAPDAIAAALAGVMIGVLAGWVSDATGPASPTGPAAPMLTVRLPL